MQKKEIVFNFEEKKQLLEIYDITRWQQVGDTWQYKYWDHYRNINCHLIDAVRAITNAISLDMDMSWVDGQHEIILTRQKPSAISADGNNSFRNAT